MNIIITNLSTLRKNAEQYSYTSDLGIINGTNTNDAPVSYFLTLLTKQRTSDTIRIIAVKTEEADAAFAAFKTNAESAQKELGINNLEILPVEMSEMATTIHKIVTLIPKGSHVYIDTTGGFRNSSYLLMAVVRILEYSGIRLEKAVYSRYEPSCKEIVDVTMNYRLFDLISAANSFTEFGNSRGLSNYFQGHGHIEVQQVLAAMNDFSEAVALCRTAGLDNILIKLNESLTALDSMQTDNENEIMFQSISGVIRQKFGIETGGRKADYLSVIRWCLEHQLIQQGVTIYTEKIGTYLFRNGFLAASPQVIQELQSDPNHFDLYYRLFYERFMALSVSYASSPTPIGRFFVSIKGKEDVVQAISQSESTEQFLRKMPEYSTILGNDERHGMDRLFRVKHAVYDAEGYRLHPNTVRNRLRGFPELQGIPEACKANAPIGFVNQVMTNTKLYSSLQGDYTNPVPVYHNHHINTIEYLEDALGEQEDFTLCIPVTNMQEIMRDYLYIKNFLRNSFNHASDKNDRTQEEITYFQNHGYPTDELAALQDIVPVMQAAIQHCKEAKL